MGFAKLQKIEGLYHSVGVGNLPSIFQSFPRYSIWGIKDSGIGYQYISSDSCTNCTFTTHYLGDVNRLHSNTGIYPLSRLSNGTRFMSTQVKAPAQARQMGALKISMVSPGIIYEPYKPREPIPFWRRWFTRSGWKRTKEDIVFELRNAYAVAKLRKVAGYSRKQFYEEAIQLYKEINTLMIKDDKTMLRKAVTENMYSELKNEIKQRQTIWKSVYWELIEPVVKIRTLRARMIGIDKDDLNKAFVQLTIEFLTKQKFEAYDSNGSVVSGDKTKELLVRDIWVFERSLFHAGAYWRLCGRISL